MAPFLLGVRLQTIHEKAEAIQTVLPLLHVHHPATDSAIQYERTPEGREPPKPDPCEQYECRSCPVERCPEEKWEKEKRFYDRRYRTGELSRALDVLYEQSRCVAQATYYEYVEPWDEFMPAKRRKYAKAGTYFLAGFIRGDVPAFSLDPICQPWRSQARDLHAQGYSARAIAKMLGRNRQSIRAALHNLLIKEGKLHERSGG